jgi:hypothetical protein
MGSQCNVTTFSNIPNVAYTRNQLEVVAKVEEPPWPQSQKRFIIETLEKRHKRKLLVLF